MPIARPLDIVFYWGDGFFSKLITWFTKGPSHVAVVTAAGLVQDKPKYRPQVVEALAMRGVVERPIHTKGYRIEIYRPTNIPLNIRVEMVRDVRGFIDQTYTERVLIYHLLHLDKLLAPIFGKLWRVCSVIPGTVFGKWGYDFSSDHPASLSPAELYDYVVSEAAAWGNYELVTTYSDREEES